MKKERKICENKIEKAFPFWKETMFINMKISYSWEGSIITSYHTIELFINNPTEDITEINMKLWVKCRPLQ